MINTGKVKENISYYNIIDVVVYAGIFFIILYARYLGRQSYESFLGITKEDGLAEYLTAIFLMASCLIFAVRAINSFHKKRFKWFVTNIILFLLFLFGTGEEISWGQRILNIESGKFFLEKNAQSEINIHNLEVGGVNLNRQIISKLMFVGIIFYFIALKLLVRYIKFFRKLVVDLNLPIPRFHHLFFLSLSVLTASTIHLVRESELYEMALAAVLFLVFINPSPIKEFSDRGKVSVNQ